MAFTSSSAANGTRFQDGFGALPFAYGTIVSSLVALVIAVPLAIAVAVFVTEMCPRSLRKPISYATELLAAIPSVIYGLVGDFRAGPTIAPICGTVADEIFLMDWLIRGPGIRNWNAGRRNGSGDHDYPNHFLDHSRGAVGGPATAARGSALALGATRWEMVRIAVLRNARAGIMGAVILGLGRALGETIAVTMVIGNAPHIAKSLLAPGYTMASVIANEFAEATGDLYLSALMEIGLALFIVTIIVNILAGLMVWTVTRGTPVRAHGQ